MLHVMKARRSSTILLKKMSIGLFLLFALVTGVRAEQIELFGKAEMGGQSLDFSMQLSETEHFRNQISGYQSLLTGFDGQVFWRTENGAGPFEVDFSEKEIWVLVHWMLSGYWLSDQAAINWSHDPQTGQAIFGLKNGRLKLTTGHSRKQLKAMQTNKQNSRLPKKITVTNLPQALTIEFSGDQQMVNRKFPKQVIINGIGEVEKFEITAAKSHSSVFKTSSIKPGVQFPNTTFDSAAASQIEIKQAKSGHIFVKPLINGEKVGWFLFDSGAGGTMLTKELIDKYGFKRVAKTVAGGIGGVHGFRDVYQGGQLSLGPISIKNLNYKTYYPERSMAPKLLGEPVVGVLGWDILLRSVVEVDMKKAKMAIYNPKAYQIPSERRKRLFLHWKVPYVKADFSPNHNGIFMLDTGGGKGGIFFPNFSVRTYDLLKGQSAKRTNAQGAGGRIPIIRGSIDWFEIAGHRTYKAAAAFSLGEDHEADIFSTGFLGGAVIEPFKVVFDYSRNEVGFIKR